MKNFRTYTLAVEFYRLARPLKLSRHLKLQLERAASSVALNLAEGAGRRGRADQCHFYTIAYGSLKECQAILELELSSEHAVAKKADILAAHLFRLVKAAGG